MMRIGLIGAGWVTRHHLDAYRQLSNRARVVAIADPSTAARESRATTYDIEGVYAEAADMLENECLDAVDIATPRETHAAMCRLAAAKGLPILCQKPLAPTLTEAQSLIASLPAGTRLMVHENWRFRPHYRLIRQWLDDGPIGNIRQVLMKIFTSGLIPDADRHFYAVDRQPFFATLDRLILMEVMIHHVDTLRFLLGALRLDGARLGHSCAGVRGDDRATLLMSSPEGTAIVLTGDFVAHGYPESQFDHMEILGETGSIRLTGKTLELIGAKTSSIEIDLEANYKASYRDAITHFLDCIDSGATFETSPADNLETLKIVEKAYQRGGF